MAEERLQRVQKHVEGSPFAQRLGFIALEAQSGYVRLRLPFASDLLQSLGRIHGGALFTLADHASGWAAFTMLEPGERCATLEMKINYIAAVHEEDCIAEARVVHKGRTSIVVEAEVKTSNERLIAKTLATFIVLREAEKTPA